jgi:hypothetical protein
MKIFENEVKPLYSVVLEEVSCRDLKSSGQHIVLGKEQSSSVVYIYKDNGKTSLQRVMEYPILGKCLLDEVKKTMKKTCPEAFIN